MSIQSSLGYSDRKAFHMDGKYALYKVDENCSNQKVFLIGIIYCGITFTEFQVLLLNYDLLKEQTNL